jgi:hypothetical protein
MLQLTHNTTETGDLKAAWFKDPDGNILSVVNR